LWETANLGGALKKKGVYSLKPTRAGSRRIRGGKKETFAKKKGLAGLW